MRVAYKHSIEYKALKLIERSRHNVLLRHDFDKLGSYRQISRVLANLIQKRQLVKIGFGIYAKAYDSEFIDEPMIVDGFDNAAREALNRLNVDWDIGSAERANLEGRSQQLPVKEIVQLKSRLRRTIEYMGLKLYFEESVNAK